VRERQAVAPLCFDAPQSSAGPRKQANSGQAAARRRTSTAAVGRSVLDDTPACATPLAASRIDGEGRPCERRMSLLSAEMAGVQPGGDRARPYPESREFDPGCARQEIRRSLSGLLLRPGIHDAGRQGSPPPADRTGRLSGLNTRHRFCPLGVQPARRSESVSGAVLAVKCHAVQDGDGDCGRF
jgi:hypothetical protein